MNHAMEEPDPDYIPSPTTRITPKTMAEKIKLIEELIELVKGYAPPSEISKTEGTSSKQAIFLQGFIAYIRKTDFSIWDKNEFDDNLASYKQEYLQSKPEKERLLEGDYIVLKNLMGFRFQDACNRSNTVNPQESFIGAA